MVVGYSSIIAPLRAEADSWLAGCGGRVYTLNSGYKSLFQGVARIEYFSTLNTQTGRRTAAAIEETDPVAWAVLAPEMKACA